MRKPKTYYVTRGDLTGTGATKTEARQDLERQIDWACRAPGPIVEYRHGLLIVVAASSSGIETMVINPAELGHGESRTASCLSGQRDLADELARARLHAAQNAWTHATDDAAFVAASGLTPEHTRGLASWIVFQRKYKVAIDAGETPSRAHGLACGYMA